MFDATSNDLIFTFADGWTIPAKLKSLEQHMDSPIEYREGGISIAMRFPGRREINLTVYMEAADAAGWQERVNSLDNYKADAVYGDAVLHGCWPKSVQVDMAWDAAEVEIISDSLIEPPEIPAVNLTIKPERPTMARVRLIE